MLTFGTIAAVIMVLIAVTLAGVLLWAFLKFSEGFDFEDYADYMEDHENE